MKKTIISCLALSAVVLSCTNRNWETLNPPVEVPVTTCDTNNVTYDNAIKEIAKVSCGSENSSCHDNSGNGGNDFSTTAGLVKDGGNGSLVERIELDPLESKFMPKSPYTLSDCDKKKIKAWVNQGMK